MSRHTLPRLAVLASLLAGAACSDAGGPGGAGPDGTGPDPEVMAGLVAGSGSPGLTGSRACPAGGETVSAFHSEVDPDLATATDGDTLTASFDGTLEFRQCGYRVENKTVTVDGNSQMDGLTKLRIVDRKRGVTELIENRNHHVGVQRMRGDGFDETCSFDLRGTEIPAQGIRELTGTMCGHTIRLTLPDPGH